MRVCVIAIDGGRGKTGGGAVQGCSGQVNSSYIHTSLHLTYIHKYMHANT